MAQDDAAWLAKSPALREKLIAMGLVEPEPIPEKVIIPTLDAFLDDYIARHVKSRKPATVAVWKQVVARRYKTLHERPESIRLKLTGENAIKPNAGILKISKQMSDRYPFTINANQTEIHFSLNQNTANDFRVGQGVD